MLGRTWGAASLYQGVFFLLGHLLGWKGPSGFVLPWRSPYRESTHMAHFHFACTWPLLFFSGASCILSSLFLFMLQRVCSPPEGYLFLISTQHV